MADERIRSFVAVDLPDPARCAAAEVARALRTSPGGEAVRLVRAEALHVTLRFLGNVETSRISVLVEHVAAGIGGLVSFQLELGGVHVFPLRRPRVIALDVTPEAPLGELAAAVERGVVAAGFEPEERSFRAHLTLGRVRGREAPGVAGVAPPPPTPFDVTEAVLFRSDLGPRGASHTPLERMALRGCISP